MIDPKELDEIEGDVCDAKEAYDGGPLPVAFFPEAFDTITRLIAEVRKLQETTGYEVAAKWRDKCDKLQEEVETWKLRADKRWSQLDIDTASELGLLKLQNMKLSSELHEMREAIKLND